MQITLAGKSFPLSPPSGMSALDVRLTFPGLEPEQRLRLVRWAFGVVGLSWAGKKLGWPDLASVKHDLLAYGEAVFSGLQAEGLVKSDDDSAAVINAAYGVLDALSPKAEAIQEARDFSPATSEKTSGEVAPRP